MNKKAKSKVSTNKYSFYPLKSFVIKPILKFEIYIILYEISLKSKICHYPSVFIFEKLYLILFLPGWHFLKTPNFCQFFRISYDGERVGCNISNIDHNHYTPYNCIELLLLDPFHIHHIQNFYEH